jgi:hypothetical protein
LERSRENKRHETKKGAVMQNRAAIMYGTHDIRLEDKPVPEPGSKEVLVEIRAVGVCGSDMHYYEEGRIGSFVVREPSWLWEKRPPNTRSVSGWHWNRAFPI